MIVFDTHTVSAKTIFPFLTARFPLKTFWLGPYDDFHVSFPGIHQANEIEVWIEGFVEGWEAAKIIQKILDKHLEDR
jgi:hypothetical protein